MDFLKVDIENKPSVTGKKNPLQFIGYDAQAMFLDYSNTNGGAIYLIKKDSWSIIVAHLDTYGIDFEVISKHSLRGV